MLNPDKIKEVLIKNKILSKAGVDKTEAEAASKKIPLEKYLIFKKIISEETLYELLANYLKVPFIDLKSEVVRKDILNIIPEPIAQKHQIVAFNRTENELKVATQDPENLEVFEFIKKKTGLDLKIYLTNSESIAQALKQYHKGLKARFKEITKEEEKEGVEKIKEEKDLKKLAQDLPIIRLVDTLLEYAIFENASDIHIEPTEKEIVVRYRIDGILREVMLLPQKIHSGIVARIKVLSNLKIDEHRLPQDGRFKVQFDEYKVSFRVSIIPLYDGEKIVLRLLMESARLETLEQLGLLPKQLEIIKRNIKKPHGIILVTGPTGCGKTTTLYALLNILNNRGVNIATIEDPVEYRLEGINQSQVNPRIGYTFTRGLRSIMRQDPDIIMVGEVRDNETAEIAIHSALTGHLVLSTFHTNDAVGAIPRLLDMGTPPFLLASSANLIVAQRLVRKICPDCIQSYNLDKKNIKAIESHLDIKNLLGVMVREGAIASVTAPVEELLFYRGRGCNKCNMEGYKGRIGIFEVLEINKKISSLILTKANSEVVSQEALKQGMITLIQDGFIKAKNGVTTIEEILRVAKE